MKERSRATLYSIFFGVITSMLLGCLVPERFEAEVVFRDDGSYTFEYSGTVVFAMALGEMDSSGHIPSNVESDLKDLAPKIAEGSGVKKSVYKGNARYEVVIEETKSPAKKLEVFDGFFTIQTNRDDIIEIKTASLSEKNISDLEQAGLSVNGTFEVKVPKGFDVVAHNADGTPTLLRRTYKWDIGTLDKAVSMKIRRLE